MRNILVSIALCGFALAGCGSGDGDDAFRPPPGPVAASITISSSAPTMPSDNSAPVTITVLARDVNNVLLAEVPVSFSATSGGLVVAGPATGANGEAIATLSTANNATLRTITVTATSGALTASTLVQVVAPVISAPPPSVSKGSNTGTNSKAGVRAVSLAAGGSAAAQAASSKSTVGLFSESAIVFTGSPCIAESFEAITAVADVPPAFVSAAGTGTVQVLFADLSGKPLGAGTTISGSVEGAGISLVSPSTFTVPCTTDPTAYPFTITKTVAAGAGALTITVTSPSGAESVLSYPILSN